MPDPTTFGQRLRASRVARGRSIEWLADQVGLTRLTIQRYEMDRRQPEIDAAAKMARVLGVSLDWLTGLSERKTPAVGRATAQKGE